MALWWKRCPARFAFILENPLRRPLLQPDRLIESLRLPARACVVDIGAGVGVVAAEVADRLTEGQVVLVEPQTAMLARARQKVASRGSVSVAYVNAVAEHLPLSDAIADVVLLVTVLGEVDDAEVVVAEAHRVLRAGGILSITEHLPDPDFRSVTGVRALVGRLGFTEREMRGGRWSYTVNFLKAPRASE